VSDKDDAFEVRDLDFWYDDFKALEDLSFGIKAKAITAFIGPSGCGKSTLLRCLNRLNDLVPDAKIDGTIELFGKNIYDEDIDLPSLRRQVAMIFQQPNPFPFSIYDNVAYGPRIHGIKSKGELDDIVKSSLEKAALWREVKDKLTDSGLELSGGQQQRLCIARALAVGPEVLLMDEPCSAIDPISTQKIEDLMYELREKLTIVIVTHNMQQAGRISSWTAFLLAEDEGGSAKLIEYGKTSEIFTKPKDERTENYITGRFG
jgi:phosphate transport system ATP-binding protein